MILYIANKNASSWSLRPWILMRELGIPFEERLIPFSEGGSHASFRTVSPTGRLPCLHDGEDVVWDSLAIVEHLFETRPEVWPDDRRARTWARSCAAEMHAGFAGLRAACPMNVSARIRLDRRPEALEADLGRLAELWDEGLRRFGGPFLAADRFTAVDAFFAPVGLRFQTYGLEVGDPAMTYLDRLVRLPGMRAWQEDARAEAPSSPSGLDARGARRGA